MLEHVDLHENNFMGPLPTKFPLSLVTVDLSCNKISGAIPPGLSSLVALTILDLHDNRLSGDITLSLSKLTSLKVLNISNNSLNGQIPLGIGYAFENLRAFDLSSNQLEGPIHVTF